MIFEIIGGVLTAAGGAVFISGATFIDRSEGYELFPVGLAVSGASAAAIGIALVGYGSYAPRPRGSSTATNASKAADCFSARK